MTPRLVAYYSFAVGAALLGACKGASGPTGSGPEQPPPDAGPIDAGGTPGPPPTGAHVTVDIAGTATGFTFINDTTTSQVVTCTGSPCSRPTSTSATP
jgi:hypothetical protein